MKDYSHSKKEPGQVQNYSISGIDFFFESELSTLNISVHSDRIIRFRYAPYKEFERDFSYALSPSYAPVYDGFYKFTEYGTHYEIATSLVSCLIDKMTMTISIVDKEGVVVLEDERGFHWEDYIEHGGNIVYCSKKIQYAEVFLGLGDKATDLDLRGKILVNWGSDMFGYEKNSDPLYKNIPFYYGLQSNIAYGIFLNNTFKTTFDFGFNNFKVMSFWADGGEMDYYFIYGPELLTVTQQYHKLTGVPELPPLWSLGYHQSRWSYYPDTQVVDIANTFRKHGLPCDTVYLDIEYMDGYKCFTWDKTSFPDPSKLIEDLSKLGFKAVAILDPGIKIDPAYSIYNEAKELGYFCKRADGPLMKGNVWPGECNFPDFTNEKVRAWWGEKCHALTDVGLAGIWNDMNEPAVFGIHTFPNDVRHNFDGEECSHRKAHNVYGMQMARATYEGLKKLKPNVRHFSLTRSGFSGVQRYAAVWTGDNQSTWEHLWLANLQCQRLSISGLSFCGSDIGGFIGNPNGELFVRWLQLGVFHPLMRGHSSKDYPPKEPWVYGDTYTEIAKKYLELRYQLLPYLYTAMWQYCQNGIPVLKSLCFLDQTNLHTYYRKEEFLFGDHILACPVSTPDVESRILFLPKGQWYNFWSEDKYEGNREIITYCPIDICPIFIRAGAVIPMHPVIQNTNEYYKMDVLPLRVYYSDKLCESKLYEDRGEGLEYTEGNSTIKTFFTYSFNQEFSIEQSISGNYEVKYSKYQLQVHGIAPGTKVFVDLKLVDVIDQNGIYIVEVDKNFKKIVFKNRL